MGPFIYYYFILFGLLHSSPLKEFLPQNYTQNELS